MEEQNFIDWFKGRMCYIETVDKTCASCHNSFEHKSTQGTRSHRCKVLPTTTFEVSRTGTCDLWKERQLTNME